MRDNEDFAKAVRILEEIDDERRTGARGRRGTDANPKFLERMLLILMILNLVSLLMNMHHN